MKMAPSLVYEPNVFVHIFFTGCVHRHDIRPRNEIRSFLFYERIDYEYDRNTKST